MKTIITIGRQFGSGGKEVGIRVAKELGIPFYDKELLQEAAKKSGLCEKIFENFDERPKSLLYSIAMDSYMFTLPGAGAGDSLEQQVYLATFNTIRHLAEEGPCVIIGRCADYALADNPNHLSLFIYAPMDVRIARVAKRVLVMNHGRVAMYDETAAVFSRAKELTGIGLAIPAVTRVFMLLRDKGYPVGENVYTVQQAAERLLPLLKKGGGADA